MVHSTKILWLIPFASFIIGYTFIGFIAQNKVLKAPSVVGLPLDKALVLLSKYNLNARITSSKEETELHEGTVLQQTPAPGKAIKENQSLYLMISQKPPPVKIPNLKNKSREEAQKLIETQSLQPKIYMVDYDSYGEYCIAQFPNYDALPIDNTVTIYCSQSDNKPVVMPNLKNKNIDEVISFLSLHSITPTILKSNLENPHSIILDQRPLPGSIVWLSGSKAATIQLEV